ncbi:MAG: leucine-rich repeat protein [Oscillospiraceae bacterium]|nr:leucine-rich repeat protein [Oscillospiraceae bacterium]
MNLKKMLAVVSAFCMMGTVIPFLPAQEIAVIQASAEEEYEEYTEGIYENLTYYKYADHIEISGYTEDLEGEIVIPAEIEGLPVTGIQECTFSFCTNLKSVMLPDSITNIGFDAFYQCTSLTSVIIPNSVASIGDRAFCDCEKLTSVTLPDSITSIKDFTFSGCTGLTSFTIPDSVTDIGLCAFASCTSLISVTIPDSVTTIGDYAFVYCTSLSSVTIQNPDCEISDTSLTICNAYDAELEKAEFNGTIYGYENSTALAYAEKYGRNFEVIGSAPETSEAYQQGDADGNQKIDILDVITLNKAVMGKETLSENSLKAIDFNGNGKPDSEEALTILKYIVGLIPELA